MFLPKYGELPWISPTQYVKLAHWVGLYEKQKKHRRIVYVTGNEWHFSKVPPRCCAPSATLLRQSTSPSVLYALVLLLPSDQLSWWAKLGCLWISPVWVQKLYWSSVWLTWINMHPWLNPQWLTYHLRWLHLWADTSGHCWCACWQTYVFKSLM